MIITKKRSENINYKMMRKKEKNNMNLYETSRK